MQVTAGTEVRRRSAESPKWNRKEVHCQRQTARHSVHHDMGLIWMPEGSYTRTPCLIGSNTLTTVSMPLGSPKNLLFLKQTQSTLSAPVCQWKGLASRSNWHYSSVDAVHTNVGLNGAVRSNPPRLQMPATIHSPLHLFSFLLYLTSQTLVGYTGRDTRVLVSSSYKCGRTTFALPT